MDIVNDMKLRNAVQGIFILSGAAGLSYEIVWARQLVLVFGNTIQAIATIQAGYFGGIGSVLGEWVPDRLRARRSAALVQGYPPWTDSQPGQQTGKH